MEVDRLTICKGCGVVAPSARKECSQCQTAFSGAPLVVSYSPDSLYCARALAEFRCGACTFWTPIDGIHVGEAIECNRCGLQQPWSERAWQELVAETRGIADLTRSPLRVDTLNPFRELGVERTSYLFQRTVGDNSLRAWVTPGHPVCERCHVPLELAGERGNLRTRCPSCADSVLYAAPIPARTEHSLRGAIALAHRTDRPAARVDPPVEGEAAAIRCPACGGPLPMAGPSMMVECAYCPTISVIARRTLERMGGKPADPEAWWLVFEGRSPQRHDIAERRAAFDRTLEPRTWSLGGSEGVAARRRSLQWIMFAAVFVAAGAAVAFAAVLAGR